MRVSTDWVPRASINLMSERSVVRVKVLDVCFGFLVVLLPFFQQYAGFGDLISLGEFLLMPFVLGYLISDRRSLGVHFDRYLFAFYAISVLLSILGGFPFPYFSSSEFNSALLRLVFYALLILVARKRFAWEAVKNVYLVLVTIAAAYLIVQYVYHLATGGYLPIVVSDNLVFTPEKTFTVWTEKYQWYFRPSSLFLEPSYYALFTLPALCVFALSDKNKSLPRFALLVITYALSSANSGILIAGVVLVVFLFYKKKTHIDFLLAFLVLLFVVVYFPFHNIDWISSASARFTTGGSFDNRVTRGIICFGLLDPFHQVVGVGVNNLGLYMEYHNLLTGFDGDGLDYCATWFQTLNYSGIIGFVFLAVYIISVVNRCKGRVSRTLAIALILVMAYESIMFSYRFAFLIILIEGIARAEANVASSGAVGVACE